MNILEYSVDILWTVNPKTPHLHIIPKQNHCPVPVRGRNIPP